MYNIIKTICDDLGLAFYYGEKWIHTFNSLDATFPAVFMFNIVERYLDFPIESQEKELDFAFLVLKRIDEKDYINPDASVTDVHVSEMKIKLFLFLKELRDYKSNGVPLFNSGVAWQIKVTETPNIKGIQEYVAGVYCEMKVKTKYLDSLC